MLQRTPAQYLVPATNKASCSALTTRFRNAWKLGVEGIITAARVLLDGKEQLPHGQFLDWLERDLKLGERKARMLMLVARHPVLSNRHHWCRLPPSWRTLYELSYLCRPGQSPRRMLDLIRSGKIHPFMTREEATALLPGRPQVNGKPPLCADLARLHWQFSQLTTAEAIASLRADPGGNTPQSVRELGRKLVAIAKEWQETS
jgi:hypothetical protein